MQFLRMTVDRDVGNSHKELAAGETLLMTCKEWPTMFAGYQTSRLNAPFCRWYVNAGQTYLLRESRWVFVSVPRVDSSRDIGLLP